MKIKTKNKAIVFLIMSAFFFAVMNAFVRLSGDLPTFQKMFFRNVIAAAIALIILIKNNNSLFPSNKRNLPSLLLRTLFGLSGVFCNFYAVDHLLLSDASILNKMSPFFVVVFSFLILKEKPSVFQVLTVAGAFVGALFVIKPSFTNTTFIPALVGFLGGACAGVAYTFVRKCTLGGENSAYVVFFFSMVSTLIVLPLFILNYVEMSMYQFVMLILAGLSAAGGQFMITLAYKYAPSKEISVYDFSQLVFSAGFGFILFEQIPDILSVVGYVIIMFMAVLSFLYNNKIICNRK